MILTAIAAMDRAGLIGDGLRMPWHIPSDLRRFRALTLGKPVILGRRTFESLGKPLPGRLNIVVSRRADFRAEGCRVAGSIDSALAIARDHLAATGGEETMIIGGGALYEATASLWDRLLLTVIDAAFPGDVFFPWAVVTTPPWRIDAEEFHPADAKNPHPHWFLSIGRDGPEATTARPTTRTLAAWLRDQPDTSPSDRCRGRGVAGRSTPMAEPTPNPVGGDGVDDVALLDPFGGMMAPGAEVRDLADAVEREPPGRRAALDEDHADGFAGDAEPPLDVIERGVMIAELVARDPDRDAIHPA